MTDVISEVVLGSFGSCCLAQGSTARPKCFAEVFIRIESETFEPLIDFLAFLVQKLVEN